MVEVPLRKGDRVLVYTDELIEDSNSQGETLGIDGLQRISSETCHVPLFETRQQILGRVATWRDGPVTNDTSLVLVGIL